ncbi:MAG: patatin [Acidobacteria bacterium]|nr:MAG: patatin [Acidobacteriota bacterium]
MTIPAIQDFAPDAKSDLAVMLTGGGARAAYQVGLLKGLARHFPDLRIDIITGVSAGAINAMYLAAATGSLRQKAHDLERLWIDLSCSTIYDFHLRALIPKWGKRSLRGLLDTQPLRELMSRVLGVPSWAPIDSIEDNIRRGDLTALALMTLDYSTGQNVRWVQGRYFDVHEGPNRRTEPTRFTVEHVMASSALPFVFPAARIGNAWHGDGGIRLSTPFSSALHLGATHIIAMSTGYQRTPAEASMPLVPGYPPSAQILNQLVNAIFIDALDEDAARMERMNEMLRKMRPEDRGGMKPIDLLVLRPTIDLGKLAGDYERYLPRKLKLLVRILGGNETESSDLVSMLMFERPYTRALIDAGEADVESRIDEIRVFLGDEPSQIVAAS